MAHSFSLEALMSRKIIDKVKNVAKEVCDDLGYELVDVSFQKGSKHDLLSVFIYKEEGIGLDDCELVSKSLDKLLEDDADFANPYYLEVSSPGLDRPIKTKDDYRRNLNKEVELKLYSPIDKKKNFEGILTSYDDDNVTIKVDGEDFVFAQKDISLMRQQIKF